MLAIEVIIHHWGDPIRVMCWQTFLTQKNLVRFGKNSMRRYCIGQANQIKNNLVNKKRKAFLLKKEKQK